MEILLKAIADHFTDILFAATLVTVVYIVYLASKDSY